MSSAYLPDRLISDGMAASPSGLDGGIVLAISAMCWATPVARVRRDGVADRHPDRARVGHLSLTVFVGTIMRRKQPHIYVANWFYCLHSGDRAAATFNNWHAHRSVFDEVLQLFSAPGCDDPVVVRPQRRGFFLTAPSSAYVLIRAKQAGRPIYSYRLSIVHFWALSFM